MHYGASTHMGTDRHKAASHTTKEFEDARGNVARKHKIDYALRRLCAGIVLALLVTMITYFLLSGSLESVARERLGSAATPESIKGLMTQLGFDRPAMVQYL